MSLTTLKAAAVRAYTSVAQIPLAPLLWYEWRRRETRSVNERPVEYAFALRHLAREWPKTIVDVGSGKTAWPQLLANCGFNVTAIDEVKSYWRAPLANRHHLIVRDDITHSALAERFDAATCLSVIEHIPEDAQAFEGMIKILRPGGLLILSFPYSESRFVENVYRLPGVAYGADAPFICKVYSRREIDEWQRRTRASIVEQRYFRVFSSDLWAFGHRLSPCEEVSVSDLHHLTTVAFRSPS